MNKFATALKETNTFGVTENGAIKRNTTGSKLLDMFGLGGAYRKRSDEDVILLFKNAFLEDEVYALKCLFYLRDIRGVGQGERRFFRVCMKWLAKEYPDAALRNMVHVVEFGRYDDLYVFEGTPLEKDMFDFIKKQLALDVQCKTPSLLAKWLKSENASSKETARLGAKTRKALGMTAKQYRKTLSILRERINVLERLMSAGRWADIEFDKIPSRAGLIYKNAFARHDIERAKSEKNVQTYAEFAKDTNTKVNAKVLYPYEVVDKALKLMGYGERYSRVALDDTNRLMINKYWDNLADYFKEQPFNGLVVADVSGSMIGSAASAPINVSISLAMYCAEKARGPFQNMFMTFDSTPQLLEVEGVDFCDKVGRISAAPWGGSTNIEAAFDLLLQTAIDSGCKQEDLMENLLIVSDMEFDMARGYSYWGGRDNVKSPATLMEGIAKKWENAGLRCPNLVFWNVDARSNNIAMSAKDGITFVSGMSPSIFQQLLSGKTAADLMYEVLDSERYAVIN